MKPYHYDVLNVHAFFPTVDENGTYDFEKAECIKLPGMRSFEGSANGDLSKIRADGIDYIVISSNNGYDLTLNFVQIPDNFKVKALGEVVDGATGIQYETADAEPAPFALVGEFKGSKDNIRWIYYNVTASRPNQNGDNKDNMKEPDEESLTATASPLPIVINGEEVNVVRGGVTKKMNPTTWSKWLSEVVLPAGEADPDNDGE
ncbi:MAG: hypothetical protein IJ225_10500 [Solobacterium sp.]|nr:hypothetical protein [Solobacterium sp.]